MRIEIDQSGKLENTNVSTAVGFSNGKSKSIIISSREKIKLQKYFRDIGKRRIYIYFSFSALIYLLIKSEKSIEEMIIDTEYPGQEPLIKNYIVNLCGASKKKFDKRQLYFKQIGKKSRAHYISITSYRTKRGNVRVFAQDIINLIQIKRPGI